MDKNKIRVPFTPPHVLAHLPEQSAVLLAFSGGADSRALLHLLAERRKEYGFRLYAAHVNHGIRAGEAERDRDFCLETAAEYDIPCFVLEADVPALARESKQSLEAEARRVRYEFFGTLMREHEIPLLATAHNADDLLETLIFNLTRGSGICGAESIPHVREFCGGYIVRPIIAAAKRDILTYCAENALEYVTDSTNFDTIYTRNLIRHEILPRLEKINPGVRESAARFSDAAREAGEFIDSHAEEFLLSRAGRPIPAGELNTLAPALKNQVLLRLCHDASGVCPERVHIDALSSLVLRAKECSAISLPGLTRASISGGCLVFTKDPRKKENPPSFTADLADGVNFLPGGVIIQGKPGDYIKDIENLTLTLVAKITLDPRRLPLAARSMAEGDTIRFRGMTKKARKLLSEKKIPHSQRYLLPMILSGGELIWIPGVAEGDGARVPNGITVSYYKQKSSQKER